MVFEYDLFYTCHTCHEIGWIIDRVNINKVNSIFFLKPLVFINFKKITPSYSFRPQYHPIEFESIIYTY